MHDASTTTAPAAPEQQRQAPAAPKQQQHMQALARANEVRLARAELKRKIGSGAISVADVIIECPWEASSMTIAELLASQRRWGASRTSKFLAGIGMPETKTVGSMTERQRGLLAAMI